MRVKHLITIHHKSIQNRLSISKIRARFYIKIVTVLLLLVDSIIALVNSVQVLFCILRVIIIKIKHSMLTIMNGQQMRKLVYALFSSFADILVYVLFYATVLLCFTIMINKIIHIPEGTKFDNYR